MPLIRRIAGLLRAAAIVAVVVVVVVMVVVVVVVVVVAVAAAAERAAPRKAPAGLRQCLVQPREQIRTSQDIRRGSAPSARGRSGPLPGCMHCQTECYAVVAAIVDRLCVCVRA